MKEATLKDKGFLNQFYCFEDKIGTVFKFGKLRLDLIIQFRLTESDNINEYFIARYFVDYSTNNPVYFLSNLEKIVLV